MKKQSEKNDKRKSARYDCCVPVVSKKGTAFDASQTVDIGKGGVGFVSKEFIPVDTQIAVEITLTQDGDAVLAVGRIKWIQQVQGEKNYRVGMVFTDISRDSTSRLGRYFQK